MLTRFYRITALLTTVAAATTACAPIYDSGTADAQSADSETAFVESLLSGMSLEQKVAQMIQPDIRYVTPADVRRYGIGSILNGGGAFPNMDKRARVEDWQALADAYYFASIDQSEGSAGIPILWGTDAVHGHNNVFGATLFPHNIGLGATRNIPLVEAIGHSTALGVRHTGLDWIFAPTVAVATDLRWGRTYESFGSDPQLVADMGAAAVRGIQRGGAIATAKHFIGDGGTYQGIDQGDTLVSRDTLAEVHGAGYRAAIDVDVQTVMASFNSWNGEKIHGSRTLLEGLLREQMGFQGTVVSDWNGVGQIEFCSNTNCPQAFNAGIDIAMVPTQWKDFLLNTVRQVQDGEITMERVDQAVRRVLSLKYKAGLFAGLAPSERALAPEIAASPLGDSSHRVLAAQAVRESLVLLKLRGSALPLDTAARILVTGSAADSLELQTGGWSLTWQGTGNSNGDFPGATSIYDGIAQHVAEGSGSAVLSADGSFEDRPDVAVVAFGERPYAEGEGDVEHLNHSARYPDDLRIMRRLQSAGIPVVAVFVTGRPAWVNSELNASDAFVVAWLPGSEGGAVADVLFAKAGSAETFSGRLPMAWPATDVNVRDASLPVDDFLFPFGYAMRIDEQSQEIRYSEASYAPDKARETVVFSRRSQPPWILMLGDAYNWNLRVSSNSASSQGKRIQVETIDRVVQQDAWRIRWSAEPGKPGQIYWRHTGDETVDLSAALDTDAILAVHMRVDAMPTRPVLARVDCVYPCSGEVDVTDTIIAHASDVRRAGDEWFDLLIPVSCFARSGTHLESVSAPLVLLSDGDFSMSVSDIRFRSRRSDDTIYDCSQQIARSPD
ncbi:MAG: glycoside hydrolase family 3 N-terminal domain-containing protein [Congregibacter sp.]